ncbi:MULTISPECIES: TraU family protein [Providencia]|uniref:TraU family protein n=1 Tax=Providencia TaxID=586 RepID=UPI001ED94608|nr:TraU family protein [Providencia rettgeri]UIX51230.1 IncF plasmid conjugative transfer pilus assembly protein TraU [Providencia rettgeri]
MKKVKLLLSSALLLTSLSYAESVQNNNTGSFTCKDNEFLTKGKMFTDVCWSCIFPIKISGANIGPSGDMPDDAAKGVFCACPDGLGVYHAGLLTGVWEPRKIMEVTRVPGCFSTMGGLKINVGNKYSYGTQVSDTGHEIDTNSGISFYHYHYYSAPLLRILDLWLPKGCQPDAYSDFDIISFSEIDPTWHSATLAFFQHPESVAVANIIAHQACTMESVAITGGGKPMNKLWWCAGSWGGQYPLTGSTSSRDTPRTTSLTAAKSLSLEHRRGLARLTVGREVACKPRVYPTIPKQQYKFNMVYPTPETKSSHVLGETPYKWQGGSFRYPTGSGQESTYMIFQWMDCCRIIL